MWASFLLVLMIASILCFCFSTSWNFRRSAWAAKPNSKLLPQIPSLYNLTNLVDDPLEICDEPSYTSNLKVQKDCFTEPAPSLVILDMALNIVLTLEFLLKVLLAPDKHKFLTSFVSIIDMVNLVTYWIYISVFYFSYYHKKPGGILEVSKSLKPPNNLWLLNILAMTQIMRILRIFKVAKISRGLRVLMLTVKKSIPELMLLAFLLMNGMFMFSCMIYMAEYSVNDTFADIPEAFWWSIITLTTVGYGDTYPKGTAGYFVGSMAAISGCIVTGLAIPIIGNNFNTYYMYMKNQLKEDKYLKELRRDINSTSGNNIMKGLSGFAEKTGIPMLHRKYRQFRADKQYTLSNRITNANALKREEARRKGRPVVSPVKRKHFPFSESADNLKRGLLAGRDNISPGVEGTDPRMNARSSLNRERASMVAAIEAHRQSLIPSPGDAVGDRRTSMLHPLATDGLLNSIPSSQIHTSGSILRPELEEPSDLELDEIGYIPPTVGKTNSSGAEIRHRPNGEHSDPLGDGRFEMPSPHFDRDSPLTYHTGLKRNYV